MSGSAPRRRRWPPAPGRLRWGDLGGTEPVSRAFGGDRGTPIDRHYIDGFLARHAADIWGRVLEVGDDAYTTRFGGERVRRADVLDRPDSGNPRATILADLTRPDALPEGAFDCIVVTQVLHMIYELRAAVASLARGLKPGGIVLATIPGITQIDREDGPELWSWAMTQSAARRLFEEALPGGSVEAEVHGNVYAATAFLQGLALEEVDAEKLAVLDPLYPVTTGIRARKARTRARTAA